MLLKTSSPESPRIFDFVPIAPQIGSLWRYEQVPDPHNQTQLALESVLREVRSSLYNCFWEMAYCFHERISFRQQPLSEGRFPPKLCTAKPRTSKETL